MSELRPSHADLRDDAPYPAGVSHDVRKADELLAEAQQWVTDTEQPGDIAAVGCEDTLREAIECLERARQEVCE